MKDYYLEIEIGGKNMKKAIIAILVVIFLIGISTGEVIASTGHDENYNDYSSEYAEGEQPDPDDIPGMNRAEDRTRNKDN